jgi:hypothetical protein
MECLDTLFYCVVSIPAEEYTSFDFRFKKYIFLEVCVTKDSEIFCAVTVVFVICPGLKKASELQQMGTVQQKIKFNFRLLFK